MNESYNWFVSYFGRDLKSSVIGLDLTYDVSGELRRLSQRTQRGLLQGWSTDGKTMIRLAVIYFTILFAIGFVLGTLRVILLVPNMGARSAELVEIPVMLVAIYFAGRWIALRTASRRQALEVGCLALAILLVAEVSLAAILFRKPPMEALFNKDPVSGTAYYLSLVVFAVMPWWLFDRQP